MREKLQEKSEQFRSRWGWKRILLLILSLIPSAVILIWQPLGMTFSQAAVAAGLVLALIWWVSKLVERTVASIVLLLIFCIFSGTSASDIFTLPISDTFWLIVLSFLFSEGVKNSGLLDKLLVPALTRFATSIWRILLSMLVVDLVMIFIIPQPFSRIILVAMIYDRFFLHIGLEDSQRYPLMFFLHICAVNINMGLLQGDLILNSALVSVSGSGLTEGEWARWMFVPALLFAAAALVIFRFSFRSQLGTFPKPEPAHVGSWTRRDIRNLIFLIIVIVLWATEDFHGISGLLIVLVATILMFPFGLLRLPDFRCIDVKLLVFLTAAFSIGSVMMASGTAEVIFSQFSSIFPSSFSLGYLLLILVITMCMHMILGSSITTLSVVIPGLMIITGGVVPFNVLIFSVYIVSTCHTLLPLHNVVTMIGEGRKCFRSRDLTRYGLIMTVPIILFVLFVFYGWWTFFC